MSGARSRRYLIPEVVQTSAMDCGPAALAALLQGLGWPVSYPRLRELCQTDVDGTSIDTLEELACELGADAEQVMRPTDSILDGEHSALPCIAVVNLPSGLTHFVVAWRQLFGHVQVMDPITGRRWMPRAQFLASLYEHELEVPTEAWLAYARSEEFLADLRRRLQDCLGTSRVDTVLAQAVAAGNWQALADLDALARLAGAAPTGQADSINALFDAFERTPTELRALLPSQCFQVVATDDPQRLRLRGAVLLRLKGQAAAPSFATATQDPARTETRDGRSLLRRLGDVLAEKRLQKTTPLLALAGLVVGMETLIHGLLFRFLLDFRLVRDPLLLALVGTALLLPLGMGILLDRGAFGYAASVGRRLDTLLRVRLLQRLPRMRDAYFQSRLVSDLADRGHAITQLRQLPEVLVNATAAVARVFWVAIGLLWLVPGSALAVIAMVALIVLVPILLYSGIAEQDLRMRAHLAALGLINLDSVRAAEPVWAHGAESAVRHQQENLLTHWRRTGIALLGTTTLAESVITGAVTVIAVWLMASQVTHGTLAVGSLLLLAFWSLSLPLMARDIFAMLRVLPQLRNILARVLELFAPDELERVEDVSGFTAPVSLTFRHAHVVRGDQQVLRDINLSIPAGQQVAIVGTSGAGKSTLLDALAGFQPLTSGELLIDDRLASPSVLARLRETTAYTDAELYLWNRSIVDNLLYGRNAAGIKLSDAITATGLRDDLARQREGLATRAGENGARLSGGEGQRVRITRSLLRARPPLVLLDEPFRGMDRGHRQHLLTDTLTRWKGTTLLFVTHDVRETRRFDRVLVIEHGGIVEDGAPDELARHAGSRYSELLDAERAADERMSSEWQHWTIAQGRLEVNDES
jgi:ABC-type bacteriocin/lantibiotic exporter with double-glycine peptidase domain